MSTYGSSGRKRLALVVMLFLMPICILGYLFVKQSQKDIAFAEKEIAGVHYLEAVYPLLHQLAAGTIPASTGDFVVAATRYDRAMSSSRQSTELLTALRAPSATPGSIFPALRELIVRIGDQSNLILDPDLDSYYLMDLVLMRLPDAAVLSYQLGQDLDSFDPGADLSPEQEARLLLLAGQLEAARAGAAHSFAAAFAANAGGQVRRALGTTAIDLGSQIQGFILAAQGQLQARPGGGLLRGLAFEPVTSQQARLNDEMLKAWHKTARELTTLLQSRSDTLSMRLKLATSVSALVALIALALAFGIFRTMISKLDERIVFLAHHDGLTGLMNREAFATRAERVLQEAAPGEMTAIMFLDLDRFKQLNDTLGHRTGDEAIVAMAGRITGIVGPEHLVCRLGGDEFVILCRRMASPAEIAVIAKGILAAMRQPFVFGDKSFSSSASIGVAYAPDHGSSLNGLMVDADLALYAAKAAGRDQVKVYDETLRIKSQRRADIEQRIRIALAEDRFSVEYLPQVDREGRELRGFEALLRLRDGFGEMLSASDIIPVAEQTKLMADVGAVVIRKACHMAVHWPPHLFVAVNLSAIELAESDVATTIANALSLSGLSPHRLEVEIGEGVLQDAKPLVLAQLRRIRDMGVRVVADKFGAGNGGLNHLWQFPFDKVKIASALTAGAADHSSSIGRVVSGIVAMGRDLGLNVVAEGVETRAQQAALAGMGCDLMQGHLFGQPIMDTDLAGFVLLHAGPRDAAMAGGEVPEALRAVSQSTR